MQDLQRQAERGLCCPSALPQCWPAPLLLGQPLPPSLLQSQVKPASPAPPPCAAPACHAAAFTPELAVVWAKQFCGHCLTCGVVSSCQISGFMSFSSLLGCFAHTRVFALLSACMVLPVMSKFLLTCRLEQVLKLRLVCRRQHRCNTSWTQNAIQLLT